jgi:hypothetical protein
VLESVAPVPAKLAPVPVAIWLSSFQGSGAGVGPSAAHGAQMLRPVRGCLREGYGFRQLTAPLGLWSQTESCGQHLSL